jgi:tetratricopeptide (TPR) repeat protein
MTEPLKEFGTAPESIEFKSEPLPAETESEGQLPLTQSLEQAPRTQEPLTLTPYEPMEISADLSPAVDALVVAANQNSSSGNLEVASATIERAIRIEPRNANLYYKLALVRLKQSKPRLAEDLAKKSALLAVNDSALKKHSWLLIAHARELQNNFKGAKEARAKANRL